MKVTLLESSVGAGKSQQVLASYLINDVVAIDAGSLGFATPLDIQRRIQHVFLSHSHMDHVASVPIFVDNTYVPGPDCPSIYANAATLQSLRSDIFNDRIWPDMIRLSAEESPFLQMEELVSEVSVEAVGIKVTPVQLEHVVPTMGFLVEDAESAIAIVSDTSPTTRIWELINARQNLKAVFLECSFPNSMEWLARKAMHLTPALFRAELAKLSHDVPVIAVHIKPAFDTQIVSELKALGLERIEIGQPGRIYEFA